MLLTYFNPLNVGNLKHNCVTSTCNINITCYTLWSYMILYQENVNENHLWWGYNLSFHITQFSCHQSRPLQVVQKCIKKNCMYIFLNFKTNYNCVLDCSIIKKYMLSKACTGRKHLVTKKMKREYWSYFYIEHKIYVLNKK